MDTTDADITIIDATVLSEVNDQGVRFDSQLDETQLTDEQLSEALVPLVSALEQGVCGAVEHCCVEKLDRFDSIATRQACLADGFDPRFLIRPVTLGWVEFNAAHLDPCVDELSHFFNELGCEQPPLSRVGLVAILQTLDSCRSAYRSLLVEGSQCRSNLEQGASPTLEFGLCPDGFDCANDTQQCTALKNLGEECGPVKCARGLFCDFYSDDEDAPPTCKPALVHDAPCRRSSECRSEHCAASAAPTSTSDARTCQVFPWSLLCVTDSNE